MRQRKSLVQDGNNNFRSILKEIILLLVHGLYRLCNQSLYDLWLAKMVRILILLSSDVSWYRDTLDMMHRYSRSLYHFISSHRLGDDP